MSETQFKKIHELSQEKIKNEFQRDGLWHQYALRINNLERIEKECWKNFELENGIEKRQQILGDLTNLQSIISNFYESVRKIHESDAKRGYFR